MLILFFFFLWTISNSFMLPSLNVMLIIAEQSIFATFEFCIKDAWLRMTFVASTRDTIWISTHFGNMLISAGIFITAKSILVIATDIQGSYFLISNQNSVKSFSCFFVWNKSSTSCSISCFSSNYTILLVFILHLVLLNSLLFYFVLFMIWLQIISPSFVLAVGQVKLLKIVKKIHDMFWECLKGRITILCRQLFACLPDLTDSLR